MATVDLTVSVVSHRCGLRCVQWTRNQFRAGARRTERPFRAVASGNPKMFPHWILRLVLHDQMKLAVRLQQCGVNDIEAAVVK